jgi:hypothetical protein
VFTEIWCWCGCLRFFVAPQAMVATGSWDQFSRDGLSMLELISGQRVTKQPRSGR